MTPDEAAAVLGVRRDADGAEIDRAYRHLARELHPDRFAGRPAADIRAANERFVDVTRARDVLLRSALDRVPGPTDGTGGTGGRGGDATGGGHRGTRSGATARPWIRIVDERVVDAPTPDAAGPSSWWLFATWTLLLLVGAVLALSGLPVWSPVDLSVRVGLLVGAAIATGLTGRRWVWRTTLVLIGVNAVATVLATTIGGLLGLGFMIVASFGLAVQVRLVRFPDQ
jgi:hypothetical protein